MQQLHSSIPRAPRAFTLLELLIAISITVIMVSILGFVFVVSVNATRTASGRVSVIERLRASDLRLGQEIGAMIPVARTQSAGDPANPGLGAYYYVSPSGDELTFTTATTENGQPVTVDVRYKLENDPNNPGRSILVRYRDSTGPYNPTNPTQPNTDPVTGASLYKLGDYNFVTPYTQADIMIANIIPSSFMFSVVNPPPPPNPSDTSFAPRVLPAAVTLTLSFTSENGDPNQALVTTLTFPVYRGI